LSYCDAGEVSVRTTAVIGTGGIRSVIARELASGGETLRLSSADNESERMLAAEIGRAAVVAVDNRDALRGAPMPSSSGPASTDQARFIETGTRFSATGQQLGGRRASDAIIEVRLNIMYIIGT
jgi:hypothetical protein